MRTMTVSMTQLLSMLLIAWALGLLGGWQIWGGRSR